MEANNRFVGSYPTVLNARLIPTDVSPDTVTLLFKASIDASFRARTKTPGRGAPAESSGAAFVVVTSLSRISARADPTTTFVAIEPLIASDVPSPNEDPPELSAKPSSSAISAFISCASTVRVPLLSVAPSRSAVAPLSTTLRTTAPPMAIESDPVTFPRLGTRPLAELSGLHRSRLV